MRVKVALSLALLLCCAAAAQTRARRAEPAAKAAPAATLAEDEKAINDLQARDIAANLALDVDKLMDLRTADVVYLAPGRAPLVGAAAVRQYYEGIARKLANADILAYEENWQEVRVFGDYAYQWGSTFLRIKPPESDKETATTENMLRILARQPDGSWKISRVIWNPAPENASKKQAVD
jgi:uncharacterized protein (TIGR02246 family)